MSHKEAALSFLSLVTSGHVREAYEKHIHPDFQHHNQYFKGDRASLMGGMEENEKNFPRKQFAVKNIVEEGDTVITHSSLKFGAPQMPDMSVVHILRFQDGKIIEMWDVGQQLEKDSPNENGPF